MAYRKVVVASSLAAVESYIDFEQHLLQKLAEVVATARLADSNSFSGSAHSHSVADYLISHSVAESADDSASDLAHFGSKPDYSS